MTKIKNFVPNAITLMALFCGFLAIVVAFQNHLQQALVLLLVAAIFDFLDGLAARVLNAKSEIGAQLDSLSDLVTFGVAPGVMVYVMLDTVTAIELFQAMIANSYNENISQPNIGELIAISNVATYPLPFPNDFTPWFFRGGASPIWGDLWSFRLVVKHEIGLKVMAISAMTPIAGALRLAKFNTLPPSKDFKGLAIPAAGLFIASIPVVLEQLLLNGYDISALLNKYLLSICVVVISGMMLLNVKMFSLKLSSLKWKDAAVQYIFVLLSVGIAVGCLLIKNMWLAIPLIVLLYLIVSLINNLIRHNEV